MRATFSFVIAAVLSAWFVSCSPSPKEADAPLHASPDSNSVALSRVAISAVLDSLNLAAANADFNTYFSFYAEDAVFMGTDATENWNKQDFMVWAKPYFDRGKAWSFTVLERNIFVDSSGTIAWFDELLDTQMKICRGSGVVRKQGNNWKIEQYVLSMTVPNPLVDAIVTIKSPVEDMLIDSLKRK